ncbi:hypothetical protein GQR58_003462 [Nymphon striatum]|nr:hypothetical protein GQR58_003462 [Nymphon striatum]
MKENNPERYEEYLRKQRERAKQQRDELRNELKKRRPSEEAKRKQEREKENNRERQGRYIEKLKEKAEDNAAAKKKRPKLTVKLKSFDAAPGPSNSTRADKENQREKWRTAKKKYRSTVSRQKKQIIKKKDQSPARLFTEVENATSELRKDKGGKLAVKRFTIAVASKLVKTASSGKKRYAKAPAATVTHYGVMGNDKLTEPVDIHSTQEEAHTIIVLYSVELHKPGANNLFSSDTDIFILALSKQLQVGHESSLIIGTADNPRKVMLLHIYEALGQDKGGAITGLHAISAAGRIYGKGKVSHDPTGNDWYKEGGELAIDWEEGLPAPELVMEMLSCTCSRECLEDICTCLRNKMKSTSLRKLATCANQMPEEDEEELTFLRAAFYEVTYWKKICWWDQCTEKGREEDPRPKTQDPSKW